MKQTVAWLLALILMITMTGCGKEEAPAEPAPETIGPRKNDTHQITEGTIRHEVHPAQPPV